MASQGAGKAANCIDSACRFDYNANGNTAARNKGLPSWHTLVWDAENYLSHKQESQGILVEQYWYGVGGAHVKKTGGNIDQAHTVGEWIAVEQLREAVEVYTRLIKDLCA